MDQSDMQLKTLYKIGGIVAVLMVAIIVTQLVIFISMPPPLEGSAAEWFALFQKNSLVGLLDFELLMIVYTIIAIPLYAALYFALKPVGQPYMTVFLLLSIIGVSAFIVARPAFEMLRLSQQYISATTELQRSIYLAAGENLLAAFHGTAFQVSYVLGSISGLILSYTIFKSGVFSRSTAYVRMASSLFDFGIFIPIIGTLLSIVAVLLLLVWDILIARRLFQLAKPEASSRVRVSQSGVVRS